MQLFVPCALYSLVKGERMVRSALRTQLDHDSLHIVKDVVKLFPFTHPSHHPSMDGII